MESFLLVFIGYILFSFDCSFNCGYMTCILKLPVRDKQFT